MAAARPWILTLLSAVALPLGFVGFDFWPIALVAYVPLLMAIEGVTPGRAAILGLVCGFLANAFGHLWLPQTIHVYGGLPWVVAWFLACLLFAYQGIVFALVGTLVSRLRRSGHSIFWVAPVVVVSVETLFPLVLPIFMGASLHRFTLLIQAVDLLGPQLLTAVLVLCNVSVLVAIGVLLGRRPLRWTRVLAGPAALLALAAYGTFRTPVVERSFESGTRLTIGVVQPNLGMFEKWREPEKGLRRHQTASRRLEAAGAELILWPEAAYVVAPIDRAAPRAPDEVTRGLRVPLLFGALTREIEGVRKTDYNSAIMIEPSGRVAGVYDKVHLLAFSETLPGGRLLSWAYDLTPIEQGLRHGAGPRSLPFVRGGTRYRIAPLICFEDILPGFTRKAMKVTRAHLLVNMTNDAWFDDSPAAKIHFILSKFRAVEHRRYLVRATNNGVSAVIDPCGRVARRLPGSESAELLSEVHLLDGTTLYRRLGNCFGYASVLVVAISLWRGRRDVATTPEGDR